MNASRPSSLRRALAGAVLPALVVASCGSAPDDDPPADGGASEDPADAGTVVPPDDIGVGGGEPIDDLANEDEQDDVDGDGAAENVNADPTD